MTRGSGDTSLVRVYVEVGAKRTFAAALDWPGWCRSGRTEQSALVVLGAYARRYAAVAAEAGLAFPISPSSLDREQGADLPFEVVERLVGDATTDFGAPSVVPEHDAEPLTEDDAARHAALVAASWRILDQVAAEAPEELRKGPRGGGRDRDEIVRHVMDAETAYLRKLGLTTRALPAAGSNGSTERSDEVVRLLRAVRDATPHEPHGWPPRYAARRIAWHVLDHAWEIEDRRQIEDYPGPEWSQGGVIRQRRGSGTI
jgi:hypothetical protein